MNERMLLESTYDATCTVIQSVPDKRDGETVVEDTIVLKNQPCALSHNANPSAKQGEVNASINQSITLFISPDVKIVPGSKIEVTQYGRVYKLEASGMPSVYPTHQEINLIEVGKA